MQPRYGWLPVDFRHGNFNLEFEVSDGLQDPLTELYNAVMDISPGKTIQVTWWLEPGAYLFDLSELEKKYCLNIFELDDLHRENEEKKLVYTISGDATDILEPIRAELKRFYTLGLHENGWNSQLADHRIKDLMA